MTTRAEERRLDEPRRRDLADVAHGGVLNLIGLLGAAGFNAVLVVVVIRTLDTAELGLFFEGVAFFIIVSRSSAPF